MLCDREEVEDVLHFLVLCDEFEWERQKLLKRTKFMSLRGPVSENSIGVPPLRILCGL